MGNPKPSKKDIKPQTKAQKKAEERKAAADELGVRRDDKYLDKAGKGKAGDDNLSKLFENWRKDVED